MRTKKSIRESLGWEDNKVFQVFTHASALYNLNLPPGTTSIQCLKFHLAQWEFHSPATHSIERYKIEKSAREKNSSGMMNKEDYGTFTEYISQL